jgi:hypothetical protein
VSHLESVRGVLCKFQGREKGGVGIVLVALRVVTEATGNEVRIPGSSRNYKSLAAASVSASAAIGPAYQMWKRPDPIWRASST